MLSVKDINAWYGLSHIVQGISFDVAKGEVIAILGRNGAGKTTLLRTIMGLIPRRAGSVLFDGQEISALPIHERYHRGLAYVPEDRRIVPGLTVRENLRLGYVAYRGKGDEDKAIEEACETFPRLRQRLDQEGVTMSGGEQQMLTIARALMARPKMILLDEPSEGIMPVMIDEMYELFGRWKEQGLSVILIEQDVERALEVADHAYIIDQGQVIFSDTAKSLLNDKAMQERYCSV
jgi:branched-chain amino acid transport system ATP-binding protein